MLWDNNGNPELLTLRFIILHDIHQKYNSNF